MKKIFLLFVGLVCINTLSAKVIGTVNGYSITLQEANEV